VADGALSAPHGGRVWPTSGFGWNPLPAKDAKARRRIPASLEHNSRDEFPDNTGVKWEIAADRQCNPARPPVSASRVFRTGTGRRPSTSALPLKQHRSQPRRHLVLANGPLKRHPLGQAGTVVVYVLLRDTMPDWQNDIPALENLAREDRVELHLRPACVRQEVGSYHQNASMRSLNAGLDALAKAVSDLQ